MLRVMFCCALVLLTIPATTIPVSAGDQAAPARAAPTFTKDVAPILFTKCARCHRPGEVAPMSLLTFSDVRPWAKAIREKVVSREMPPWHAGPNTSLKFKKDPSLTQAQIDLIAAWVDAGSPKGEDADLPPAPVFPTGWAWHRVPDYIAEVPADHEVAAEGEVPEQAFYAPIPWKEDRFAEIIEVRTTNTAVVHHSRVDIVSALPPGTSLNPKGRAVTADGEIYVRGETDARRTPPAGTQAAEQARPIEANHLLGYTPGRGVRQYDPGVGKRLPAGTYFSFNLHYQPTGKPELERSRTGIWFNQAPVTHEAVRAAVGGPYIVEGREIADQVVDVKGRAVRVPAKLPNIPPYAENWRIVGVMPVAEDITLSLLQSAHAPSWQGHEVHHHVAGRPGPGAPGRAKVRLQLAAVLRTGRRR